MRSVVVFGDRREHPRFALEGVQGLMFLSQASDVGVRAIAANLIDVGTTGIGVEMSEPLLSGSAFFLLCEFYSEGFHFELKGSAHVAYCLPRGKGTYRIGMFYRCVGCEMAQGAFAGVRSVHQFGDGESKLVPISRVFALRRAG